MGDKITLQVVNLRLVERAIANEHHVCFNLITSIHLVSLGLPAVMS